ncbi:LacI family transcriptional regulator [Duganella sp. BJB488]|uniref:LacI family DNA-binding transcriptional regulator n=1 Tax=unclassified Duganella TaxID=2636909 RepID=UPI000E34C9E8|nr:MULTISPECIES: LacI family DNA-binding transcriptional regulator [unclassified Duganella]RFP21930.1 LacI family transcriptional regulator [Duganella sp. BJB489]RFP23723.1 LacI family transcriptional regulator [Duganella sp. BJB488]RFP38890.1 LacI family transcriptional regulator [Duganella sp. BJB480]
MTKSKPTIQVCATEHKASIAREARRVTSYDVAIVAGVSQSAVSRCFKPGASVSKSTHARVMKAAALLDYIPNAAARSLITRRSNMVAVLITNKSNLYYPELLAELSEQLSALGKRVLLFPLAREADVDRVLNDVWQFQVDGAIVAARLSDDHVAEFERRGMPLVLFNRTLRNQSVNTVTCDHLEAGRTLVSRLAAAGHRRFGIIGGTTDTTVAGERRRGACERLAELGLPPPVIVPGEYDYDSGASGLKALIEKMGGVPDVILCGSDVMAIGCLDCARHELGIDVPGQLSVAGFDAVEPSNWLSYNLTTLRQPMPKMAAAAANLLCAVIDSRETLVERRLFSAQFIEGATARLHPKPTATATTAASVTGTRAPVAIM